MSETESSELTHIIGTAKQFETNSSRIRSAFVNLRCPCDSEETCAIEHLENENMSVTESLEQTHIIGTAKQFETNSSRIRSAFVSLGCPCNSEETCVIEHKDRLETDSSKQTHMIGKAKHFEANSPIVDIDGVLKEQPIHLVDTNQNKISSRRRQPIPLSDRFSCLPHKELCDQLDIDHDENAYKAEFEKLLRRKRFGQIDKDNYNETSINVNICQHSESKEILKEHKVIFDKSVKADCTEKTKYSDSNNADINNVNNEPYSSSIMDTSSEPDGVGVDEATDSGRMVQNVPECSARSNTSDIQKGSPDGNCASGRGLKGMEESIRGVKLTTTFPGNQVSSKMLGSGVKPSRISPGMPESSEILKPNTTSPVSFLDYSDDESDDELLAPLAFLRSVEEINERPFVITPTKVLESSQNSTATSTSSDLSPLKTVPRRMGVRNKFTLDGLLADYEENADLVQELDDINQELQDEIKQGGFVNILNREDAITDSQITDEQREMLKQFDVEESRICDNRPGMLVFQPQHFQCLFGMALHPTHCGFTAGSNGLSLEKHIESLNPDQYKMVIMSGIISLCFAKISCQTQLLRWLFFIMSVHEDYQVQQSCKKILLEILHRQHNCGSQKWAPRLADVLSVFVNYGATLESLVPSEANTVETIRGKLLNHPDYNQHAIQYRAGHKTESLLLVLQIVAQSLHGPSGRYNHNDLSLLCVVLCKASLDTSLINLSTLGAFQNCVAMVLHQYTEADWIKEKLKLARLLADITDHHHNQAHIAQLLASGHRGTFLQRRYSYLVLSAVLLMETNMCDVELECVEIKDLEQFVPFIKELLENDVYKLSSVITLMDLCVGVHTSMNSTQREQLKSLLENVRRVRVRDNVSMLDRTRVKDMIVRMTSKWTLEIQTMKGLQTKMFEYTSPVKMRIETVHTLQSNDEDDEDDADLPYKIQKRESTP